MKNATRLLCLLAFQVTGVTSFAREYEGSRENSVLLNGVWEFTVGSGAESAEIAIRQEELTWQQVKLPGPFMPWSQGVVRQTKCVWARRNFKLTPAQAASLAVVRWNRVANGAEAFLNGRKVGENEPTGPFQVLVPSGVLAPGDNQIVLKIRGAGGVRKSRSGNALIPAGFGVGMPEVTDDVWIDFADRAYMKWMLAMPDLAGSRVRIRVTPTGVQRLDDLRVIAQVRHWPDGKVLGEGESPARLVPNLDPLGGEHFFVAVPMPGFQPWTHEELALYTACVKLTEKERTLDEATFRFGMREFGVKDRHYQLNGKRLWLRGSNLVFEWNWGDVVRGKEKDYLVAEAREMSMNSFRTHTQPPPRAWCDICDEHGTMILAEFPVLYNYQDYRFTPEEYDIWHRNVLTDAAGWMARLWNHPSVIMWVLSNESNRDNAWEEGPFQDFVNALDPTRPTLRTGTTGTKENYDVHTCGNITEPLDGNLQPAIRGWFETAGSRATTNTEYMNIFNRPATQWVGRDDPAADQLAVAQIGAEHTEAMRRARLDGIWPYMYAGWTRTRLSARVRETGKGSAVWKGGYAAPQSAAWHSTLSPLLASLDLFDPDYATGQQVTTDVHVINDSWHDAEVHVDLLLTQECPEYIPEAACFDKPVGRWGFDFSSNADSVEKVPVTWKLPEAEGRYWLTARLTGVAGRPVLSQRFVRAINPSIISSTLKEKTFIVLGNSDVARGFFQSHGLRTSDRVDESSPETCVVVVWDATRLTENEKRNAKALCDFASREGRVVVMSTSSWDWRELCDVKVSRHPHCSRVFPYGEIASSLLDGIDPNWLIRWNGLPGTVALGAIEGEAMARAERLLWAREPQTTVLAMVPAATGDGRILFSQLDLQRHVEASQPDYDPVAERVFLHLLGCETDR